MLLRLFLLFTVIPITELYLLLQLGRFMGPLPTLALVLTTGALGAWLARGQGLAVLGELRTEFNAGRLPTNALIDGLLVLMAGAVLLTPGLLTDVAGFLLLLPPGRRQVRRFLVERFRRRFERPNPAEGKDPRRSHNVVVILDDDQFQEP